MTTAYRWAVVTKTGTFSIHKDRERADYWAERVGGEAVPWVPNERNEK